MRGNAMSGAPINSGTNQLPKPPIKRRHDGEKDHDDAVARHQDVVGMGPEILQAGFLQLEAHRNR